MCIWGLRLVKLSTSFWVLDRRSSSPVFREDMNLAIFLEYDKELAVRGKNKKERLAGLLSSFQKTGDELLLSNTQKDVDNFFETEKTFLMTYHGHLKVGSMLSLFIFVHLGSPASSGFLYTHSFVAFI